jgi:outer membrane biosynthesis protein TonB
LALLLSLAGAAGWLAGCATKVPLPPATPAPSRPVAPSPAPAPSPNAARTWDEFRLRAAQRLVAANPDITYTGAVPEPLLAIPVLSVELKADGSIANVEVMRYPSQAKDTTQIAIDAVRRAAPFGDVSRLPKPWKYIETFLFNDERRFKPVTLDR